MDYSLGFSFGWMGKGIYNCQYTVKNCTNYILKQAKWLPEHSLEIQVSTQVWDQIISWLLSMTWFLPFLGPIVALFSYLCRIWHSKLTCQVSSHLESIKVQMLIKIKMTCSCGPLNNPTHGQPWCLGPFHFPLSAGSNYWTDFVVLFLMAVKEIIQRGELEDRQREVHIFPKDGD
jgi:hypothetical protein